MKRALRVWEEHSPSLGNGLSYADMDKLFAAVDNANAKEIRDLKDRIRLLKQAAAAKESDDAVRPQA